MDDAITQKELEMETRSVPGARQSYRTLLKGENEQNINSTVITTEMWLCNTSKRGL
jgi:hypothetical protein